MECYKMKNRGVKSILAWVLGLVMLFGLAPATSFAVMQDASITIKGIPATDTVTVTAYQVVAAKYENTDNTNQVTGYQNVAPAAFADPASPTADEWKALIKKDFSQATPISLTKDGSGDYVVNTLEAGLYVIFITGSTEGNIYNPLMAGINYKPAEEGQPEDLVNTQITLPSDFTLNSAVLYAKLNQPEVKKESYDPTPEDQSTGHETANNGAGTVNPKGNGTEIGEKIDFKVTTTIPSYSEDYTQAIFNVVDTLSAGITPPQTSEITVKVGGSVVPPATDPDTSPYTLTVTGQEIKVAFDSAYVLGLRATNATERAVEITYKAALNEKALRNFDSNKNDVKIEYSHNPDNYQDLKEDKDRTYHYTFDIDGKVSGHAEGKWETYELTKHHDLKQTGSGTYSDTTALAGAKFGLWKAAENGAEPEWTTNPKAFKEVNTATDGRMYFGGLDEGIYYVKEILPPSGYSLNKDVFKVEIKADYNEDGTLASYSIIINGQATSTYTATYNKESGEPVITIKPLDQSTLAQWLINNTKLGELPSTGGMGTYIFIAVGALFVTGAIYLAQLIFKKKRQLDHK